MTTDRLILASVITLVFVGCHRADTMTPRMNYPSTAKGDVVDDYGGVKVPDPYRWMEALDSQEVADWVKAQNAVTEPYLESLPLRQHFHDRLTELWNYGRVGVPQIEHGRLFYTRNTGLQRQSPVFARMHADGPPALVIDPNAISEDGSVSLSQWKVSPDGRLLAYTLSEGGADWGTVKVRDLVNGRDLADDVRWMRFSNLSWTKDSKGFFYSRYPEPLKNKVLEAALAGHALYYHRVGTLQAQDSLIYRRPDLPPWIIIGSVTEDGRYLLVTMFKGAENKNRLFYADLITPLAPRIGAAVKPIVELDDAEYAPIGNRGSIVFLRTDLDAPNRRIVTVDLQDLDRDPWPTVLPEASQVIEDVRLVGGRIVVHYLADVQSRLRLFGLDGTAQGEVTLPGVGAVGTLGGREDSPEIWYSFSSPVMPATVYRYDPASRLSVTFDPPRLPVDTGGLETTAMFATSKDGTRVPFFLTAKKGLARNGNNPVMIYGYGGFSVSMLPTYRQDVPAWLERGGVWVTANIRGGAEYGEAWHQAGMLDRKQNVFDDFIAVAEHLVHEQYTSPARLGIWGGSNGGLLVGAVMEQRPDLYAVALPEVGVMDMLRYDQFTGGALWTTEYGSPSDPTQFGLLMKYSPVHNLKPGTCYPATLITTADHDDRVVPSHSFKFASALQAAQKCDRPALIRVEVHGSHGYRPTDKLIAERADQWAFAAANMGVR